MIERHWGRIINISGLAARSTGNMIGSIRNVSVVALTKNLAEELGPKGINVTVVHPGLTRTEKTPDVIAQRASKVGPSGSFMTVECKISSVAACAVGNSSSSPSKSSCS